MPSFCTTIQQRAAAPSRGALARAPEKENSFATCPGSDGSRASRSRRLHGGSRSARLRPSTPPPRAGREPGRRRRRGRRPRSPKRRRGTRGGAGRKKPAHRRRPRPRERRRRADEKRRAASEARAKDGKPPRARRERAPAPAAAAAAPQRRAPLPPAKRELLVSVDVGEQRVAVLEDGRVAEVYLERPERRSIAGNIYKGTVDNVLPGMEAAFVEIGLEKNGFLYVDEIVVPELEGKRPRPAHPGPDQARPGGARPGGQGPDEDEGRAAHDRDLAARPLRRLRPARRGPRRLAPARGRRAHAPEGRSSRRSTPKQGGVIVRTAAEGASAEDIERDLVFLQRLWKSIQARAKAAQAPSLVYQEAELPLRVMRDLFTGDFERALIDHDRTYKRIVGYLKKTSPHMVERVDRYKEKTPLFEAFGVDAEIRSTLNRRVDLPSGGYLIFDYAEAFTVIDVNTGRFVGSRSKSSGARLEDTITKNNLEAVKEVVRQLRLRDIGGIIVIDFIDMANPKNRADGRGGAARRSSSATARRRTSSRSRRSASSR